MVLWGENNEGDVPDPLGAENRRALFQRAREYAARGPIPLVVVDAQLPGNQLATVNIRRRGFLERCVVMWEQDLSEGAVNRAHAIAFEYFMRYPDDHGPVTITLLRDGGFEIRSEAVGEIKGRLSTRHLGEDTDAENDYLLDQLAVSAYQDVPGVGRARVVHFERE